jgi:hypothetical protein
MSKARVAAVRSVDIGVTDLARALKFFTDVWHLKRAQRLFCFSDDGYSLIRTSGEPTPRHQHCLIGMSNQLAWMFAALMISPHFLRSCRMISANSSGLLPTMVTPNSRVNRCIEGCCTAAAI